LSLLFALVAGESEYVIKTAAQNAKDWYFNTAGISSNNLIDNLKLNNSPNPFSNSTIINFHLTKSSTINLEIFDANGRIIQKINKGKLNLGNHSFKVDLTNYNSGIYYYRLTTDWVSISKKMILN